jgi:hypothetical protein
MGGTLPMAILIFSAEVVAETGLLYTINVHREVLKA